MGFLKFIVNLSPGSPKATALKCIERFDFFSQENKQASTNEIFLMIYNERLMKNIEIGVFHQSLFGRIDSGELLSSCEEDFSTFIYCLMSIESEKFRVGCKNNDLTHKIAVESIFEAIKQHKPTLVKKNLSQINEDCYAFCTNPYI